MGIEKVGFLNKIFGISKKRAIKNTGNVELRDSINISSEAKMMAEINKYKEVISKMPDVRMDKVEAVKEKLRNQSYMSKEIYAAVADKLSEFLDI
ncbi:MAG: hypothetical protein CVV50_05660 [Spirochaetae bacterium HGW-Spirochaetae-6]|jgi:anti-sigma28 factor (negative regulator of flagellin synthesis)|nr:MAG: hypothetical protein CVV50_05660 [Spirochaetae bacterium HGW-Spirochaetae-6]